MMTFSGPCKTPNDFEFLTYRIDDLIITGIDGLWGWEEQKEDNPSLYKLF